MIQLLLILSLCAFAASSETALFSLDRFQLRQIKDKAESAYDRIQTLIRYPTRLLIVILMINETANMSVANLVTNFVESYSHFWGDSFSTQYKMFLSSIISTVIATPLMLMFGEITPKILASRMNRLVAMVNSKPLVFLYKILLPLLWLIDGIVSWILTLNANKENHHKQHLSKYVQIINEQDFVAILDEAHKEGTIEPSERALIQRVLRLNDVSAKEVMTNMEKAFVLKSGTSVRSAMREIESQLYSRVPIVDSKTNQITGILYSKDLLFAEHSDKFLDMPVDKLTTKAMTVPESISLNALFKRFKKNKIHIAVVTNRTHVPVGIVTMEDLLESIFGQIADERDVVPT